MKMPIALALLAVMALAASPATAAERACRPSLSNLYHCPDKSAPATTATPTTSSQPSSASSKRPCRPSLSNGFSCPGTSSASGGPTSPKKTTSLPPRRCRPSLSNGYNCQGQAGADQYSTDMAAWVNCPADTVVWANLNSDIYHFRGTPRYGNTKHGAYMCEQESLHAGMRAAKNEKHP